MICIWSKRNFSRRISSIPTYNALSEWQIECAVHERPYFSHGALRSFGNAKDRLLKHFDPEASFRGEGLTFLRLVNQNRQGTDAASVPRGHAVDFVLPVITTPAAFVHCGRIVQARNVPKCLIS